MDPQTTEANAAAATATPAPPPAATPKKPTVEIDWLAHRVQTNKQLNREEIHLRAVKSPGGHALDLCIENPKQFGLIKQGAKVRMTLTVD